MADLVEGHVRETDAIRTESKESVSYGNWNFGCGETASDLIMLDVDASKIEMLKREPPIACGDLALAPLDHTGASVETRHRVDMRTSRPQRSPNLLMN
ncbi:MAG: hypothetical protein M3495_00020 [Pseudomonadota bacterium]|nr:hypothetical protein [Pseudomonadota bacterium]